jgi:hypothetical protein
MRSSQSLFSLLMLAPQFRASVRIGSFASILACSRHVWLVGNLGSEGYALLSPFAKTLQLKGTLWACLNMFFGSTSALIFISLARLSPQ